MMKKAIIMTIALLCIVTQWAVAQTPSQVTNADGLQAAMNNSESVILTNDITLSTTLLVKDGCTATIDLCGHTLSRGLGSSNTSGGSTGHVIEVQTNATLTITDTSSKEGSITGGYADYGGAIYNRGTVYIYYVNITGNRATANGGAVCNRGKLWLCTGSNITGNTASGYGSGVYTEGEQIQIQGNVVVKDNTRDDLYLAAGKLIDVGDEITSGAGSIGIRMEQPGSFTSNYSTFMQSMECPFFSSIAPDVDNIDIDSSGPRLSIGYYECSWDETAQKVVRTLRHIPADAIPKNINNLTPASNNNIDLSSTSGGKDIWYFSDGTATLSNRVYCKQDTKIVLCNGAKLTMTKGLKVRRDDNAVLHLYVQSYDDGTMGKLTVTSEDSDAGIGSPDGNSAGTIEIHGGDINATGGKYGAGIGGGEDSSNGILVIYDGKIKAFSGVDAAAIGGGEGGSGGTITIYGGEVTAHADFENSNGAGIGGGQYNDGGGNSGTITIWGGTVNAYGGRYSAAIGGGEDGNGETITIYNGTVTAEGGDGTDFGAAGIGGGACGVGGTITIYDGTIIANGKHGGAGIGGGAQGNQGGDITIAGGNVRAVSHGGYYVTSGGAGIGGGAWVDGIGGHGGNIIISGGTVYAKGGDGSYVNDDTAGGSGAGIGSGGVGVHHLNSISTNCDITITGGTVEAHAGNLSTDREFYYNGAAGIGGGNRFVGATVTITGGTVKAYGAKSRPAIGGGFTNDHKGTLYIPDNYQVIAGYDEETAPLIAADNRVDACQDSENRYVLIERCKHSGSSIAIYTGLAHTKGECAYCLDNNSIEPHFFGDDSSCICGLYALQDGGDNTTVIEAQQGKTVPVVLYDRVFYKIDEWNTICLPFDYDLTDTEGRLYGATVMELDTDGTYEGRKTGFDASSGTLYLYFKDVTESIEAGKPYIIKWADGQNVVSPIFNATLTSTTPAIISSKDNGDGLGSVSFVGTYSPAEIFTTEKTNLYIGAGNKLYYPWADGMTSFMVNSCRAYFRLNNGLTAGEPTTGAGINAFVLNFGDTSEQTGITSISTDSNDTKDSWYSLSGMKLYAKPTAKGIYIYKGRKIVIK